MPEDFPIPFLSMMPWTLEILGLLMTLETLDTPAMLVTCTMSEDREHSLNSLGILGLDTKIHMAARSPPVRMRSRFHMGPQIQAMAPELPRKQLDILSWRKKSTKVTRIRVDTQQAYIEDMKEQVCQVLNGRKLIGLSQLLVRVEIQTGKGHPISRTQADK